MTDRHCAYIVVLGDNVRDDDDEDVITALRMIKGVIEVTPVAADYSLMVATERRDAKWADALRRLARKGPEGDDK